MAASFEITGCTDTTATIRVSVDSNYPWYRVFVRLYSDTSDTTYDAWYRKYADFSVTINNLEPGTRYAVNVAYDEDGSAEGSAWIGSQSFWTEDAAVTYYATLQFDANGGSGAPSGVSGSAESQYVPITVPYGQPVRSGYTFLGWAESNTEAYPSYYPGTSYSWYGYSYNAPTGCVHTLYAVWGEEENGCVWIYTSSGWRKYRPWVYSGGWREAAAWIYSGGWKKGV